MSNNLMSPSNIRRRQQEGQRILNKARAKSIKRKKRKKDNKHYINSNNLKYDGYTNSILQKLFIKTPTKTKPGYVSARQYLNYVRHECSNYDAIVSQISGIKDENERKEKYLILKKEIMNLCAEMFPEYKEACKYAFFTSYRNNK